MKRNAEVHHQTCVVGAQAEAEAAAALEERLKKLAEEEEKLHEEKAGVDGVWTRNSRAIYKKTYTYMHFYIPGRVHTTAHASGITAVDLLDKEGAPKNLREQGSTYGNEVLTGNTVYNLVQVTGERRAYTRLPH